MSNIDPELLAEYLLEAAEHLQEMESVLMVLEKDEQRIPAYNEIFRVVHSLKGGAQYLGLEKIAALTHFLEDLLDQLRSGAKETDQKSMDLLIAGHDKLSSLCDDLEKQGEEQSNINSLLSSLKTYVDPESKWQSCEDDFIRSVLQKLDESGAFKALDASQEDHVTVSDESGMPVFVSQDNDSESDPELYAVFKENLIDNYRKLSQLRDQWPTAEKEQSINAAKTLVDNIRASANYMSYRDMMDFALAWLDALNSGIDQVSSQQYAIGQWLDKLVQVYPDLGAGSQIKPSSNPQPEPQVTAVVADTTPADVAQSATPDTASVVSAAEEFAELESDQIDLDLLPAFIVEASEHLEDVERLLLDLNEDLGNIDIMNGLFRAVHTVKGGAQFIGLARISYLAHKLEDLLGLARAEKFALSPDNCELLIRVCDRLRALLKDVEDNEVESFDVVDLAQELLNTMAGGDGQATTQTDSEPVQIPSTDISGFYGEIRDEVASETGDQELRTIFMGHLVDRVQQLEKLLASAGGGDLPANKRDYAVECIEALRSSARYMGYDRLTEYYDSWLMQANQPDVMPSDMINESLSKLYLIFPTLKQDTQQIAGVKASVPTQADTNSGNQSLMDRLGDALSEGSKPGEREQAVGEDDIEALLSDDQEEQLLDRLSDALNAAQGPADSGSIVTLHEVFDEMISSRQEAEGEKSANRSSGEQPKPQAAQKPTAAGNESVASNSASPDAKQESKAQEGELVYERRKGDRRAGSDRRTGSQGDSILKKSIRIDAEKIDVLMNQVGELVVDRSYFFQLFNEMRELQNYLKDTAGVDSKDLKQVRTFLFKLAEAIASLSRTSNDLQEGVMKVRMLPVAQLFNRFPRLVHDLTRKSGKKVNLEMKGQDTELDKMVVEELSDPLIHIIRNAMDHGMETQDERVKAGKPETGTLLLEAYQESNHIVIEVTDDGRGIDTSKIKQKALDKGLYTMEELNRMSERELIWLIMSAGFSTADKITGTSGRGVGMDVVKKNIEKLNGTLEIDTDLGKSTQVRLKIPLTLAIIAALQIRVGDSLFTIPLANVEETLNVMPNEITDIQGTEVIYLRGKTLPIFRLSELFSIDSNNDKSGDFVVVVNTGTHNIGLVVDELRGQDEVVIKPLVDYLQERSGFSGATIIGDGRISLILDINELFTMTADRQAAVHRRMQPQHVDQATVM